jgi:hypothetical protein
VISDTVGVLFDEFAAGYARGYRPDVRAYLDRAGEHADELGKLIDRYLQAVPAQAPDDETVVLFQAKLDHVTPLVAARSRRGLKMRELAERLRAALGLADGLRERVAEAYSELERGQLDPDRVDARVWEALRTLLGLDARRLAVGSTPSTAALAYYREADATAETVFGAAAARHAARPADEVDRLFGTRD